MNIIYIGTAGILTILGLVLLFTYVEKLQLRKKVVRKKYAAQKRQAYIDSRIAAAETDNG